MSRRLHYEHQNQNVPRDVGRDGEDGRRIGAVAPPPLPPGLAPMQAAPAAVQHVQNSVLPVPYWMTPVDLLYFIGMPDILSQDLRQVAASLEADVSPMDRGRACHLVTHSSHFREWMTSTRVPRLLIHGDFEPGPSVSGLSQICQYLAGMIDERPDVYIPLVFFCGLHTEPETDAYTGGHAIICSFIRQLLLRYPNPPNGAVIPVYPHEVYGIQNGDLCTLYMLFERLVRMLPCELTVCCIVDDVGCYEREGFLEGLQQVVVPILQLSLQLAGPSIPNATLKVLLTSPTATSDVCRWFPQRSILPMQSVGRGDLVTDSEDVVRELSSGMG